MTGSKRHTQDDMVHEEDGTASPGAGPSNLHPEAAEDELKSVQVKTSKKRKHAATPGIVYISRLPPGMTPQKVRHLMAKWGDVGRVYAQRRDATTGYDPKHNEKKKKRHAAANFSEAWIEFLDKAIAKTVARMLNAQVIGGKKGDRWRDDIWTMRYLSGFKWEMLGEQVAYEKQAHQARLRNEITRSKTEQSEYLRNVELARVLDKRKAKKAAQNLETGQDDRSVGAPMKGGDGGVAVGGVDKAKRDYKQRKAIDREQTKDAGENMAGVLGNVFG